MGCTKITCLLIASGKASQWGGKGAVMQGQADVNSCICGFFFSGKRKWFNVPKGVRKLSFCSWTLSSCLIKIILSRGEGGLDLAGKVLPLLSQITRDTQSNKHPLWWKNGGSRWGKDDAQTDIHWQSCYPVRPQYDSRVCALIITNLVQKILHLATDTTDYTKEGKQTSKIPKLT